MKYVLKNQELGYIVDADERLSFKDDLRSGGLLYCFHREPLSTLSLLMVWSLRDGLVSEKEPFKLLDVSSSSKHPWPAIVGFAGE